MTMVYSVFGYLGVFLSVVSYFPQIQKSFKNKNFAEYSIYFLLCNFFSGTFLFIFMVYTMNFPGIVTNIVFALSNLFLICGKYFSKHDESYEKLPFAMKDSQTVS